MGCCAGSKTVNIINESRSANDKQKVRQVVQPCTREEWIEDALSEVVKMRKKTCGRSSEDPGKILDTAQSFSDSATEWAQRRFQYLLEQRGKELPDFVIMGIGSFSRGEMAPYSDVDIFVLCKEEDKEQVKSIVNEVTGKMKKGLFRQTKELVKEGSEAKNRVGILVDTCTGATYYTPEEFVELQKMTDPEITPDMRMVYSSSEKAQDLLDEFWRKRQTQEQAESAKKKLDVYMNSKYKQRMESLESIANGKKSGIAIKDLLNLMAYPAVHLADYFDCREGKPPQTHSTTERILKLVGSAPKGLAERLVEDFQWLLQLRYQYHCQHEESILQDEISKKEEPEMWSAFTKRLDRFRTDFDDFRGWIQSQELK